MTFADWKNFLTKQEAAKQASSSDQNRSSSLVITPLMHQGLLRVSGIDAAKFLQGQLTCDVNLAVDGKSTLGSACNPQGRAYSSFRLIPAGIEDDSGYFLRMREDIAELTAANLNKYIVFFKAKTANESTLYAGIGITGKNSTDTITRIFGQAPSEESSITNTEHGLIIKLPGRTDRYEYWIAIDKAEDVWKQLSKEANYGNINDWLLEDIECGLAEINNAVSESFIPQMLNYHTTDAISFTKGCYTGQEVIARMQYRGKSKRTLIKISVAKGPAFESGQQLHTPDKQQTIATIVASATSKDNKTQDCLAVVSTEILGNKHIELCLNDQCFKAEITEFLSDTKEN